MSDDRMALIQWYVEMGWAPVPVPPRSKNPGFDGWPDFRTTASDLAAHFPPGKNVGLILGDASHGLVDVDLDTPEAQALAPLFLPPTGLVHGNERKPASHWWYIAEPVLEGVVRRKDIDGVAIVERRSNGGQTIVPPSIHPDGYAVIWERRDAPASIDGRILAAQVDRLAAAALLARHWPSGSRHDLSLAIAGALLRHGWDTEAVEDFINAVTRVAGDPEPIDRARAIRDTAKRLTSGGKATGIPTMTEILGKSVVDRFCEWLGVAREVVLDAAPTLPPVVEERRDWRGILEGTAIPTGALPYWFARLVSHVRPQTPMFPDDWALMMTLPFWSALWPRMRLQNLNLAVWSLGVGLQGTGKNVATDELRRVVNGVAAITGGDLILFTSGTPEGMWERLAGIGRQMLCYHDEFGGWLKMLQRDHMVYAREAMCSLYDGRAIGYQRAQKGGVEVHDPHVAVIATINKPDIELYASRVDLFNGYLSRFLVCAPDIVDVQPESYPFAQDPIRRELIDELGKHVARYRDVLAIEWQESGRRDPQLVLEYRAHLGVGTGKTIDLDTAGDESAIPAGRLLARVKKIAALLELAEEYPEMSADQRVILVRPEHVETAISIIERSRAYTERMIGWIGDSGDFEISQRILRYLKTSQHGMTKRELVQRTHARSTDVKVGLELLESAGLVEQVKAGKANRWRIAVAA